MLDNTQLLLTAVGLMLMFEGLLPVLIPSVWRETFKKMLSLSDGQLRTVGLIAVSLGFIVIMVAN